MKIHTLHHSLSIAPSDNQLTLFYTPPVYNCDSNASARNAYGMAAQELVYTKLGITPIRINGNYDVCFDGQRGLEYFEIKSVKRNAKVVLYKWRLEKEKLVNVELYYCIVIHTLKGQRDDLLQAMLAHLDNILIVKASDVYQLALTYPLHFYRQTKFTSTRNGYSRSGYSDGYYSIPVNKLKELPNAKLHS